MYITYYIQEDQCVALQTVIEVVSRDVPSRLRYRVIQWWYHTVGTYVTCSVIMYVILTYRSDVAIRFGTVSVVVHRPVVPVLRRMRWTLAIMVHFAVWSAVLGLLLPLVNVMWVFRAPTAATRLLLLDLGFFFLLHSLVLCAPVLEPDLNLRTEMTWLLYNLIAY